MARCINSFGVIEAMAGVMFTRGVPEHIRSYAGAEMTARDIIRRNPEPGEDLIRRQLGEYMCRCTSYGNIVAAIKSAAAEIHSVPLPADVPWSWHSLSASGLLLSRYE